MSIRSTARSAASRRTALAGAAFVAALGSLLVLAGCTAGGSSSAAPIELRLAEEPDGVVSENAEADDAELLADYGLAGLDARGIVDRLDAMPVTERPAALLASVQPGQLVVTDDRGREAELPMPEGEFYLSIAPYEQSTHDCHFHSLTTCLGELQNESVAVRVVDDATGEALVDDTRSTFDNGFVGVWLPRGIEATVTIEHGALTGTAHISTAGPDDATCLTTLRLS